MERLKNLALFLAAPFIALAYIIVLPFMGIYMFIKLAIEGAHKKYEAVKHKSEWKESISTHYQ